MSKLTDYTTLVEAEAAFREKGFTAHFGFEEGCLVDLSTKKNYVCGELTVIGRHRFEGASNPADSSILFAIKAEDGTKGLLSSAFGPSADAALFKFVGQVKIADHTEVSSPPFEQ